MEDLLPVLEPLAEATQLLTSESVPTGSSVYLMLVNLLSGLQTTDVDSVALTELKGTIQKKIMTRFGVNNLGHPDDHENILALSAILDPRSKSLRFLSDPLREQIQDTLVSLLNEQVEVPLEQVHIQVKQEPGLNPPARKKSRLMDCLSPDVIDLTTRDDTSNVEHELERYIAEPVHISNPLEWWKINDVKFPRIAALAKKYLCVPATEVPSERSFSAADGTVTKLRAALDPDNVDKLTFVHKNYIFPQRLTCEATIVKAPVSLPQANVSHATNTVTQLKVEQEAGPSNNTDGSTRTPMLPEINTPEDL